MQAIITKFLGPTTHRGSRIKASAEAGSVIVSWDHALNIDGNHAAAAKALAAKFGWHGEYTGGTIPYVGNRSGWDYAFVLAHAMNTRFTVSD